MKTKLAVLSLLLAGGTVAFGQYTNKSDVLDGSGTRSSGGTYLNQAGFLNTFCMKPGLLGAHGLPVELDPDNDGDGLNDDVEMAGSSFNPVAPTNPNLADSDGDGTPDNEEAVAGTNPMDANALLELVTIRRTGYVELNFMARSNKNYQIVYADTPDKPVTNLLTYFTFTGYATSPWYATNCIWSDFSVNPTNSRIYGVRVLP